MLDLPTLALPFSPPTHTYHPTVPEFLCVAKILHPQLSSHSALEVNIIKYTLILKYSVFYSVYQKCVCHM